MPDMMCLERLGENSRKKRWRYVMKVVLERYHGLGNDYVVFDPNKNELELTPENVKMI